MITNTNYIRHLNAFFARVQQDDRLRPHHISLYLALFQVWNQQRFQQSFPIKREDIIRLCHIGSLNTYTNCLKELHQFRYIIYQPDPQRGALPRISMVPLKTGNAGKAPAQLPLFSTFSIEETATSPSSSSTSVSRPISATACRKTGTRHRIKIATTRRKNDIAISRNTDTGAVAELRRFYNKHINNKKTERENTRSRIKKFRKYTVKNPRREPVIPPPAAARAAASPAPPSLQEVQQFFQLAGYPDTEARKFFYHYQASGWRLGGQVLITHWPAAAHKWMLNVLPPKTQQHATTQRNTLQPGRLHVNEDKNYAEPI